MLPNCVAGADPKAETLAGAAFGALNENAGGFDSDCAPNTGLAEKLKAGDVLPKAGGALNAEFVFVFSAGFVPNILFDWAGTVELFCPKTNAALVLVVVFKPPKIPVDAVVAGVCVAFCPNVNTPDGDPNLA